MSPLSIILVLLISLVYGVIFLILSLLNYKLFEKFSIIFQFLIKFSHFSVTVLTMSAFNSLSELI